MDGLNYCIGALTSRATNEITNKMSEQTQVNAAKADEPLWVMTKDPKKVAVGKRLAEWNHKSKEKLAQATKVQPNEAQLDKAQKSDSNLSYNILLQGSLNIAPM